MWIENSHFLGISYDATDYHLEIVVATVGGGMPSVW